VTQNTVKKIPGEPSRRDHQAVQMRRSGKTYAEIARVLGYSSPWKAGAAIKRAIEWAFRQAEQERKTK